MLTKQLYHITHELVSIVDLQQYGPFQWGAPVNMSQSISNLLGPFCGQGLSGLVVACDIHHGKGIFEL